MSAKIALCMLLLGSLGACGGQQATPLDYALGWDKEFAGQDRHSAATVQAAEQGRADQWSTPRSHGIVQPDGVAYVDRSQRPCHPLTQNAAMPNMDLDRAVTACRGQDGTWVVVDRDLAPAPKE